MTEEGLSAEEKRCTGCQRVLPIARFGRRMRRQRVAIVQRCQDCERERQRRLWRDVRGPKRKESRAAARQTPTPSARWSKAQLLAEVDRLAAAVREREAWEAALVKVIERAEGPMHMYYEEHHKDGHNCQCLICMTVNHYDREAMSGADGLSKAREALAAELEDGA